MVQNRLKHTQSIVHARVYSQCLYYLGYINLFSKYDLFFFAAQIWQLRSKMILQRVTIVMHSMTKKSNSWTRNFKSNTLALAILVILLSNAVTMTEQRSISSIYKTSSSSQEKDTTSKVETAHKIIWQGGPSWLIPKVASHKFTGNQFWHLKTFHHGMLLSYGVKFE